MSDRVKVARTLCIFFMMFVHVQTGIGDQVYDRDAGLFDMVYFVFSRILGLSSVSLLGIISGYFIVSSLAKAGYGGLLQSKLKTLVVPLVAWNLLMLALLVVYGLLSGKWHDMPPFTAIGLADALLALTRWPLDVPLWFLRDLFMCVVLSPLLLAGLRRAPLLTFLALIAYTAFGDGLYLMQRPQLLLLFATGMWLRIGGLSEAHQDRVATWLALAMVFMVALFIGLRVERIQLGDMNDQLRLTIDTMLRLTMAGGIWLLTDALRTNRIGELLMKLEPYAFVLFCSHSILFTFAGIVFRRFFGNFGSELFPITFFSLPILAVICAVIGLRLIAGSPALLALFNAGHRPPPWPRLSPRRVLAWQSSGSGKGG